MTRATVIAYHAVGTCAPEHDPHNLFVTPAAFETQMEWLARHRRVVPLERVVSGGFGPGPPAVAITFDDGYRNVLTAAAPVLRRFGFSATVFVPSAWIGKSNEWDESSRCDLGIMTAEELREVESMGVVVESHGHGHIDLGAAPSEDATRDIAESLERLAAVTGHTPRFLAYPFGRTSAAAEDAAAAAGIEASFTIDALHRGLHSFGRVPITPLDGARLFRIKTGGRYLGLRHGRAGRTAWRLARRLLGRR